jgi:hypothetical protein
LSTYVFEKLKFIGFTEELRQINELIVVYAQIADFFVINSLSKTQEIMTEE